MDQEQQQSVSGPTLLTSTSAGSNAEKVLPVSESAIKGRSNMNEQSSVSALMRELKMDTTKALLPTFTSLATKTIHPFDGVALQVLDRGRLYGKGLFAATHISAGALVLEEKPLMVVSENSKILAVNEYQTLSVEEKQKYNGLSRTSGDGSFHNEARLGLEPEIYDLGDDELDAAVDEAVRIMEIFATNNFELGEQYGLFDVISRINHGCVPNVRTWWDETLGKHTVRATKAIHAGDELRFCYLGSLATYMTTEERKAELLEKFRFHCDCSLCHADETTIAESDERRKTLKTLTNDISNYINSVSQGSGDSNPDRAAFQSAREAACLMLQEELTGHELVIVLQVATETAFDTGSLLTADYFADKCAKIAKVYHGPFSPEAKRADEFIRMNNAFMANVWKGMTVAERGEWENKKEKQNKGKTLLERKLAQLGL
ncbi:hypothetical protein MBLNU230_g1709t1 [Neophaeotheca triangularis]